MAFRSRSEVEVEAGVIRAHALAPLREEIEEYLENAAATGRIRMKWFRANPILVREDLVALIQELLDAGWAVDTKQEDERGVGTYWAISVS